MMNVSFSVNEILHFPKNLCNITDKKGFKKRQKSNGRDKSEKEYTFAMVIREFKQQLYLLTVDKDKLERIQAYREGQKLYQKQLEEWKAFEKQLLEKLLDVEKLNNFVERDRSESSSYMSYEEIEYQLLGWDK